eukprot:Phypoly_transcript_02100.p1 GENE.Phypoly_transcript_02100~~Phypoly_transcript_02100.p1  ORF type:complete len:649 (+),score=53.87 Phypoly_transcript_02100:13-1959(+)
MVDTQDVCQGTPWGPWKDGMLTECFIQVALWPPICLIILIGFIYRITSLRHSFSDTLFSKLNVLKVTLCFILLFSYVYTFMAKLIIGNLVKFRILGDVREIIVWSISIVVIWREIRTNHVHWWPVRAWWVLKFISIAMILQALDSIDVLHDEFGHPMDVVIALSRLILLGLLAFLGLYVKGGNYNLGYEPFVDRQISYGTMPDPWEVPNKSNAYKDANFFTKVFFLWPSVLINKGAEKKIDRDDLFKLPSKETVAHCVTNLEQEWEKQSYKANPLVRAIVRTHILWLLISGFLKFVQDMTVFVGPIALWGITEYVATPGASVLKGLMWVLVLFVGLIISSLASNFSVFITTRISHQIVVATTALLYRKTLQISSAEKVKFGTGAILNIIHTDAVRLGEALTKVHLIWAAPLQMLVALYLLWELLGGAMLAGFTVLLIMVPLNWAVTRKMLQFTKGMETQRDSRAKLMAEMLFGVRLVKFFNWESSFYGRLSNMREEELNQQKRASQARVGIVFVLTNSPLWAGIFSFLVYTLSGNELTATKAFTSLALFNIIRIPFGVLPLLVGSLIDGKLSLVRIQNFLYANNIDVEAVEGNDSQVFLFCFCLLFFPFPAFCFVIFFFFFFPFLGYYFYFRFCSANYARNVQMGSGI